jgi:hypothetical protein
MKSLRLAALVLLCAACRDGSKPAPDADSGSAAPVVAGEKMIDFDGPDGTYSCRAPAQWKALEDKGSGLLITLFGTSQGPLRGKVMMGISRYPDAVHIKTPQDYWASLRLTHKNPSPLEPRQLGGRTVYFTHYDYPHYPPHGWKVLYMNRIDAALIPATTGFFAVEQSAPKDSYREVLPIFDAVVASFKPKS